MSGLRYEVEGQKDCFDGFIMFLLLIRQREACRPYIVTRTNVHETLLVSIKQNFTIEVFPLNKKLNKDHM